MRLGRLGTLPCALVLATAVPIVPGEYVTERGWGVLEVKSRADGALDFGIEALGANGHTCSLAGEIRDGRAVLDTRPGTCVVTFDATGDGVRVGTVDSGPCRYFCGARAGFEDTYLRPAPGCAPTAVAASRTEFKRRYDAKQFAAARDILAPVLERCARTLGFFEIEWVRNDLALTLHRLGDDTGCRRILAPLETLAKQSDAEISGSFSPVDAEGMLAIARATRTNRRLCGVAR